MKAEVDPRLVEQLAQAGDAGEVEALLLLDDAAGAAAAKNAGGDQANATGSELMERVAKQVNQRPTQVRQYPRLGALYVKGSGKFVRHLLEADEVVSASANDAEITTAGA